MHEHLRLQNASEAAKHGAGQSRAAKAKKAAEMESESDEEVQEEAGGGTSLEGVLQHMVQGLNSQDGDRLVFHLYMLC